MHDRHLTIQELLERYDPTKHAHPLYLEDKVHLEDKVPYPIAWKRAYLALKQTIEDFQREWLQWPLTFKPSAEEPWQGNVARLLVYHLTRSRELLWAEVNGGLDEEYQSEMDALNRQAWTLDE